MADEQNTQGTPANKDTIRVNRPGGDAGAAPTAKKQTVRVSLPAQPGQANVSNPGVKKETVRINLPPKAGAPAPGSSPAAGPITSPSAKKETVHINLPPKSEGINPAATQKMSLPAATQKMTLPPVDPESQTMIERKEADPDTQTVVNRPGAATPAGAPRPGPSPVKKQTARVKTSGVTTTAPAVGPTPSPTVKLKTEAVLSEPSFASKSTVAKAMPEPTTTPGISSAPTVATMPKAGPKMTVPLVLAALFTITAIVFQFLAMRMNY